MPEDSQPPATEDSHNYPSEQHSAFSPPPPPFNPMAAAPPAAAGPDASHSVVPDLMRVYESLTNSRALEDASSHPAWSYETPMLPHPSVPNFPPESIASEPNENDTVSNSSSARSLRKRTSNNVKEETETRKRRKAKDTDGRWSKRFNWPDDLHRDFVSAIFDVGLKHSSPATVLEQMPPHEQITTERIKSHLQKYRMHRVKSKKEFMTSYDETLAKMQVEGTKTIKSLGGGEVASHLTYSTVNDEDEGETPEDEDKPTANVKPIPDTQKSTTSASVLPNDALMLPRLTEAEKQSPIGASMGYLMGLFFSLRQQLMAQRAASDKSEQVQEVYQSFQDKPRTNLEENKAMKQDMQSQMAFQNKMRALKQQELNKFKQTEPPQEGGIKDKASNEEVAQSAQGAGESARSRALSIGNPDDFWSTDMVDDQLFEFLMSDG